MLYFVKWKDQKTQITVRNLMQSVFPQSVLKESGMQQPHYFHYRFLFFSMHALPESKTGLSCSDLH